MDFLHSPNKPRDAAAVDNTTKALELRKRGLPFRAIAKELNISKTHAHDLVVRALTEIREDNRKAADLVRDLEVERLDEWMTKLASRIDDGDCVAIKTALAISERRSKLLGLDAPQRVEHSGTIALDTDGLMALLDALPGTDDPSAAPEEPLAE